MLHGGRLEIWELTVSIPKDVLLYSALQHLMCTIKILLSSCLTGHSCFKVTVLSIGIHNPTKLLVSVSVTNRTVVLRLWLLCKHLLDTIVDINAITSLNIKQDKV
jgi:hypothetical protein